LRCVARLALASVLAVALLAGLGCRRQARWENWSRVEGCGQKRSAANGQLTARFLGTSSILFEDGETAILTDGFVTRPRFLRIASSTIRLSRIAPDTSSVRLAMRCLAVDSVKAVVAMHSHYDHALDAPWFARLAKAVLVGSPSTANLGYGVGLPMKSMRVVQDGDTVRYGAFLLTFIESVHNPNDRFPGIIHEPVVPPACVGHWKTGPVWSVLVSHGGRTILVQGTAGYKPGALHGRHADVVYLAIGNLACQTDAYIDAYWQEVVVATGAKRVVLVHADDFFRDLGKPLRMMPSWRDDVGKTIRRIKQRARKDSVEVMEPALWRPAEPLAGLPAPPPVR
jgi:L-ascorbate metabolism protein UlaG (beta-lactamase superfamily)